MKLEFAVSSPIASPRAAVKGLLEAAGAAKDIACAYWVHHEAQKPLGEGELVFEDFKSEPRCK